jgi:hypothetical protein
MARTYLEPKNPLKGDDMTKDRERNEDKRFSFSNALAANFEGRDLRPHRKSLVGVYLACACLFFTLATGASTCFGQCPVGNGYADNVICFGKTSCYGAPKVFSNSSGRSWSLEASPCNCVYSVGCVIQDKILQYHQADKNERFQSRPLFFRGCNGALALALPVRKVTIAKQG